MTASLMRDPFGDFQVDEVHQDDGITHYDAGPGDKPDHGGGRKKGPHQGMAGQDADERQRDGGHDHQRHDEGFEPAHHHDVDQDQNHPEGQS